VNVFEESVSYFTLPWTSFIIYVSHLKHTLHQQLKPSHSKRPIR